MDANVNKYLYNQPQRFGTNQDLAPLMKNLVADNVSNNTTQIFVQTTAMSFIFTRVLAVEILEQMLTYQRKQMKNSM